MRLQGAKKHRSSQHPFTLACEYIIIEQYPGTRCRMTWGYPGEQGMRGQKGGIEGTTNVHRDQVSYFKTGKVDIYFKTCMTLSVNNFHDHISIFLKTITEIVYNWKI